MKNLLKYIAIAGVALVAASCEREPLTSHADEGGVNLAFDLSSVSRAVNAGDFTPEQLKVRIYRPEGTADSALIRRYTSFEEIPTPLYLVEGDYSIKVEAGDKNNVAFTEEDETLRRQKLCYEGWKSFAVARKQTSTIEVSCPTINVRANLVFDTSDSEMETSYGQQRPKYENRLISNVKITLAAITTSAQNVAEFKQAIEAEEAPVLTFEQFETKQAASGYFLMPEGVTTLVWAFEGEHETDGAIARMGTIRDVEAAHAYKVGFHYTRTPDGYAKVEVEVDDSVEVLDDKWYFKPQPEISGAGIDAAGVNRYAEGSTVTLVCESINDLTTLSLGGVNFFANGAPVADAIAGVSCVKNEPTKVTITLGSAYFDTLKGGVNLLEFGMQDAGGTDVYAQQVQFAVEGIDASRTTYDLWANTAALKAVVTSAASEVAVRFRRVGTSEWVTVPATVEADGYTYTAQTTAAWETLTNAQGHTVYKPNSNKSFFANSSYACELLVNGVTKDAATLTTTGGQTIPYATFEDSSLACYGSDTGVAPFWGSGNNSYTPELCTFSSYTGQQGSHCTKLEADLGGLSGVFELLAAGNLFTGTFSKPSTTGTVSFGVKYDWTVRPSSLKLQFWGSIGTVDRTDKSTVFLQKGAQDEASILVALVEWSSRHQVKSGTGDPSGMWNPEEGTNAVSEGRIIGYGTAYPKGQTSGSSMQEMQIDLYYYDTVTKPSANYTLVISCATSRYGDYMNGCSSSVMYVDDFRWGY